uniref:Uncharacterized protein n=1 Tax=Mycena chlorophos TaxID=658473 RepID=A0ABQ0LAT9_MYCCL|nr:predicted protein [Mycena chlorophos]
MLSPLSPSPNILSARWTTNSPQIPALSSFDALSFVAQPASPVFSDHGLGLGLSSVDASIADTPNSQRILVSVPPSPIHIADAPTPLAAEPKSLWATLADFVETTYATLLLPESPPLGALTTKLAHALMPESMNGMFFAPWPLPLSPTTTTISTSTSPQIPSPKHTFPSTGMRLPRAAVLRSPRAMKAVPWTPRRLSVHFCSSNASPRTATRPSFFEREERRAEEKLRRFRIGEAQSAWDRKRLHCLRHEAHVPVERMSGSEILERYRTAAEVEVEARWEEEEDERREREASERRLRFVLSGIPYDVVVRQQRRRCEGGEKGEERRRMVLRREREIEVVVDYET